MAPESATARKAGTGVLWLTAAKFYFMATGMVLVLILPSLFKRFAPAGEDHVRLYGEYRVVMGLINWFNMVLIGGALQAVSKFIAESPDRARSVRLEGLKIQTWIGGACTVVLLAGAPFVAEHFYGDAGLALPLQLAAPIVLIYAYYAVIIGALNGLQRFRHQASMDMLFATLKVGLTLLLVALGFGIQGAIMGFLATAAVVLGVAVWTLGSLKGTERITGKQLLSFEWKTLLYAFFLNGLLQVDLQLLKGLSPEALEGQVDITGVYAAVQQIAQIPYVGTIAVAFVVFPLISRATFEQDMEKARGYVRMTNRFILLALAGVVLVMACEASGILGLIYPKEYQSGTGLFATLALGYLFFAAMVVNANILTASGRPILSMVLFGLSLAVSLGLNWYLIPLYGAQGAAAASAGAMGLGFGGSAVLVWKQYRAFIPALSVVRGGVAAGATWVLARFVLPETPGFVWLMVRLAAEFGCYLVVLLVLREFSMSQVRGLLLRRKK